MSTKRSNVVRIDSRRPGVNREYVLNAFGDRCCTATVAAALALPVDFRETVPEWVELVESIDQSIKSTLLASARGRYAARRAAEKRELP